jgi:hypothetical protein
MKRSHKPGRNEPCECGSGRKSKHCCDARTGLDRGRKMLLFAVAGLVATGLAIAVGSAWRKDGSTKGRVWSAEHGHWHDVQ